VILLAMLGFIGYQLLNNGETPGAATRPPPRPSSSAS
jgi:hypothetical protein